MKKLVRRSIFTFIFAFAFLVCGAISVRAAEAALDNTNITGYNVSFNAEENEYYVINGEKGDKTIQLSSKSFGQYKGITMKYYTAVVSVVKCGEYDGAQKICKTWFKYDYNKSETETMDALKQKKLSIGFGEDVLKEAKGITAVNGVNLGELDSIYSVADTYFVIVQYTLQRWPLKDITYNPDILRVVFTEDLSELTVVQTKDENKTKITITSGTPINTVRYFHTTTKLEKGYDFEAEYTKSENGVVALEVAVDDAGVKDGKFTYTLDLVINDGEYYYIEASDLSGNKVIYDAFNDESNDGDRDDGSNIKENIGDTDIGKIIFISLIVVFVLAVVLVIVQKIVDYRKKLY